MHQRTMDLLEVEHNPDLADMGNAPPPNHRLAKDETPQVNWGNCQAITRRKQVHFHPEDLDTDGYYFEWECEIQWPMPHELFEELPNWLLRWVVAFNHAGAAAYTTKARLEALRKQATQRGWPLKLGLHLNRDKNKVDETGRSSSASMTLPTPPSSITSPEGSFSAHTEMHVPRLLDLRKSLARLSVAHGSPRGSAIETPPFTPESGKLTSIPETILEDMLEPIALTSCLSNDSTSQISPPASRFTTAPSFSSVDTVLTATTTTKSVRFAEDVIVHEPRAPTPPLRRARRDTRPRLGNYPFDMNAWEEYLKEYDEELWGLNVIDMPRLRTWHLRAELELRFKLYRDRKALADDVLYRFCDWWLEATERMDNMIKWQTEHKGPTLDEVRKERLALGLRV